MALAFRAKKGVTFTGLSCQASTVLSVKAHCSASRLLPQRAAGISFWRPLNRRRARKAEDSPSDDRYVPLIPIVFPQGISHFQGSMIIQIEIERRCLQLTDSLSALASLASSRHDTRQRFLKEMAAGYHCLCSPATLTG